MPSLKIEITKNLTEVVELAGPISLGRGKDNDIILLDAVVSRHHSRVYFDGPDVIIEDLNSSNGILVNDNRVFLRALQDKDVIKIGKTKIYFSTETLDSLDTLDVDLTAKPLAEYDMQKVMNARDVNFKFPSADENINQIYDITRHKFEMLSLNDMERINLDAALNEAVGNAQRHGHKFNAELAIEFRYLQKTEKLVLRITDQGEGFDYRAELQRKKAGTAVEEARARYKAGGYGGLGIMLMLKCVDSVEYNRKGNQVTLTKYLGEAAEKHKEEQRKAAEKEKQEEAAAKSNGQLEKTRDNMPAEEEEEEIAPEKPDKAKKQEGEDFRFLIEPD